MYDVYRSKKDPSERMVTLQGAGLPDHVEPNDWEPLSAEAEMYDDDPDAAADVKARGFYYFKLVS
jgi:hypothetical protein